MSTGGGAVEESSSVTRPGQEGGRSANLGAPTDWSALGVSTHVMQVYDEDAHLLDAVRHFTGTALAAGEAAVVIATPPHREQLEAHLRAQGIDLATARAQGQYVPLDAPRCWRSAWSMAGRTRGVLPT